MIVLNIGFVEEEGNSRDKQSATHRKGKRDKWAM